MARDKEKQKAQQRASAKKRYWLNKEACDKIKLEAGCCECGYNTNAYALDFDHINPAEKEFNISKRLQQYCWEKLKKEIDKCRVMCANCHRIHSYDNTRMGTT